jgi:hypothetical protein
MGPRKARPDGVEPGIQRQGGAFSGFRVRAKKRVPE